MMKFTSLHCAGKRGLPGEISLSSVDIDMGIYNATTPGHPE